MALDKGSRYTLGVALFVSIGTLLFGYDAGIITTTIAHDSWVQYMGNPSDAATGAVSSVYIAGEAIGSITQVFFGDRFGRIRFMEIACVVVTIGAILQTAAINLGMFLAGRVIAGLGVGTLCATIPIYLTEISAPASRGLIAGISGIGMAFGTMVSNWVGYACGFAPYGSVQWRLPLGLQIPYGIVLLAGLMTFLPHSPRQLIQQDRVEEARQTFARIRSDLHDQEVVREFYLMRNQIQFEFERERSLSYGAIFKLYRRRVLVSISVQVMTSVTGINVIQYYQSRLYKSLGVEANNILALAGAWGTCALISNVLAVYFLPDRWGRRRMLLTGISCIGLSEIYTAVMQREFQNTDSRLGKGFAVLGLYLFVIFYYGMLNSVTWLYGAEILPTFIRNRVVATSAASHYIVNVALTESGPSALSNIGENFYYVFVGCCACYFVGIYMFFPETKQKTLEEIAAAFGDRVVQVDEDAMAAEETAMDGKVDVEN